MLKRGQHRYRIAVSLGMIALLALMVLAPLAGSFWQQQYRFARQSELRSRKKEATAIRLIVPDTQLAGALFPKENELEYEGLRYDIVSVEKQGNCFIFKAIPDVKETRISNIAQISAAQSTATTVQKMGFPLVEYLPAQPLLLPQLSHGNHVRTIFFTTKAVRLPGFEWCYSPPPDVA